jgi:hypothetical protein
MAYTTIDDPSVYFQVNAYSGSSNPQTITNDGNSDLQPDWLWSKRRDSAAPHYLFDSIRGVNSSLSSDDADAEDTATGYLASFDSDGFTTGSDSALAYSGRTYVAWQWKANGGSTTTNDASSTGVGTIDSVYQANTTAGFSIVTHTGSGSSGTIAHGLGATPKWVLTKNRTDNSEDWANYHVGLSSAEYYIRLNTTAAQAAGSSVWGDTAPSSTVITLGGANGKNNASSKNYVSYCFAEIQGYSKFGKYTGNGNADGPFVYTGFKPAWLLIKRIAGGTGTWLLSDNQRDPINPTNKILKPDVNNAENTGYWYVDYLSNGFKVRLTDGEINGDGHTMIYMAFAEHPFVSSKGVPVTAR